MSAASPSWRPRLRPVVFLWALLALGVALAVSCASPSGLSLEAGMAEARRALGERRAEQALARLAKIEESGLLRSADERRRWAFRLLKAECLLYFPDRESQALELLSKEAPFPEADTRRLMLLGLQAYNAGDFSRAQHLYRQAHDAARRLGDSDALTEIEYNWARLYSRQGDFQRAIDTLLPAADRRLQSTDPCPLALALTNLGHYHWSLGRWPDALHWADAALPFSRQCGLDRTLSLNLLNLGTYENRLGYLRRAEEHLQQSRGLGMGFWGAAILMELGNNHFFAGEHAQALKYYQAGEEEALKDGWGLAGLLNNQFVAHAELGNCAQARKARARLQELKGGAGSQRDPLRDRLNQARLFDVCGEYKSAEAGYEDLLEDSPEPLMRVRALFGLGLTKVHQKRLREANQSFDAAIALSREVDEGFARAADRIAVFSTLVQFYRIYVDILIQQGLLERALEVSDSSRVQLLRERLRLHLRDASAADFRRLARESGAVLLSFWESPPDWHVWIVSGSGIRHVRLPAIKGESVGRWVELYRRDLEQGFPASEMPEGHKLFEMFIKPLEAHIPEGAKVVVAPDGVLHGLNFEALPAGGPGSWRFWIEQATLSVAPSLSLLALREGAPGRGLDSLLVVGDPEEVDAQRYPRLKSAGPEMETVSKHFQDSAAINLLRGAKAHPDAVLEHLRQAEGSWMLHVAAHAEANSRRPLQSSLVLSERRRRYKLYAQEILEAEWTPPRLVTLSACRTVGEKSFSGEGPIGLAWAFMAAGAPEVVASLWEVPDEATRHLMGAFYENLSQGRPVADSLRQAKLRLIEDPRFSSPWFWAGLQHYLGRRPAAGRR